MNLLTKAVLIFFCNDFSFPFVIHKRLMGRPSKIPPTTSICSALILLDRDGVINRDVGSPGVTNLSNFHLLPGSAHAIGKIKRNGGVAAIITNQSCVGKGLLSSSDLENIHEQMLQMLQCEDPDAILEKIYCCMSTKKFGDERMKPNPGMVLEALRDFHDDDSSDAVVFIGDTVTDLQAARRASDATGTTIHKILVSTGYGREITGFVPDNGPVNIENVGHMKKVSGDIDRLSSFPKEICPFVYAKDLEGAVNWLLDNKILHTN
mmetsp:Transcript_30847/g.70571  ORF Transcript_30847/g.70571 Transcript_30847/m.70571 type:complete len:264 (-) Transcript_30847:38-829(-)